MIVPLLTDHAKRSPERSPTRAARNSISSPGFVSPVGPMTAMEGHWANTGIAAVTKRTNTSASVFIRIDAVYASVENGKNYSQNFEKGVPSRIAPKGATVI